MGMSPAEKALRARIGAHALHAKYDGQEITAAARAAAASKLDARLAEEHGIDLAASDAARRLEHARSAHYARLGLRAAQARRAKREAEERERLRAELGEALSDLDDEDGGQ